MILSDISRFLFVYIVFLFGFSAGTLWDYICAYGLAL